MARQVSMENNNFRSSCKHVTCEQENVARVRDEVHVPAQRAGHGTGQRMPACEEERSTENGVATRRSHILISRHLTLGRPNPPKLRTTCEAGHVELRPPEPLPNWANS